MLKTGQPGIMWRLSVQNVITILKMEYSVYRRISMTGGGRSTSFCMTMTRIRKLTATTALRMIYALTMQAMRYACRDIIMRKVHTGR